MTPTRQDQIDTAKAAALAEEIAAVASGKMDLDAGALLSKIQERPDIEQRVTSDAEDYVTIYDNMTGMSSTIPVYMLAKKLRQRYPNETFIADQWKGRPVFALEQRVKPAVGAYKCWLHTDSPNREEMDLIGYTGTFCGKEGIPSEIAAEDHMKHKHSREYENIMRFRGQRDTKQHNNALLELLQALVEKEK